jgi:hypothetical protein
MRFKVEHRLGIKAPAHVVWSVLSDLSTWRKWNPLYPEARGVVGFGELLTLTVAYPGSKPRPLRVRVLDWAPDEAIHWKQHQLLGLIDITRYLEIEAMSESGCIFSNGQIYDGPLSLGARVGRWSRRRVKAGFTALGEALRDRAEARWNAEDPAPTSEP